MPAYKPMEMRVRDLSVAEPNSGCWLWTGCIDKWGYGKIGARSGGESLAHRASYLCFVGPIPHDLVLDHKCRTRSCVNPAHLEPVTFGENMARGEPATRTHCVNGHPFSGENIKRSGASQQRCCRACWRIRSREYKKRQARK